MSAAPWAAESLLVLIRWLHALAAALLVGSMAVILWEPWTERPPLSAQRFKELTDATMLAFLATGAILTFDRLSRGAGSTYAVVLVIKVAASVATYQWLFRWRRRKLERSAPDGRFALGAAVFAILLAALLKGVTNGGFGGP